jgi:hypothetical protein
VLASTGFTHLTSVTDVWCFDQAQLIGQRHLLRCGKRSEDYPLNASGCGDGYLYIQPLPAIAQRLVIGAVRYLAT